MLVRRCAVAVLGALGLLLGPAGCSGSSGGQAQRPTHAPAGAVPQLPGCPTGRQVARVSHGAVTVLVVANRVLGDDVCLVTGGRTTHLAADAGVTGGYAVDVPAFKDGRYVWVDRLGHLFVQTYPGNITGVTVIVPMTKGAYAVGPFPGAVVDGSAPTFALVQSSNDCVPNCAQGHQTTRRLTWSAAQGTYVGR